MPISNNNYTTSEPTVLPSRIRRAIDDFQAGMVLKAARVAEGMAPADQIEMQFKAILDLTRVQFPQKVSIVQMNMAQPSALYRTDPRYATFAHVDLRQAGAVDAVDLIAKHRPTVADFGTTWVHIPPAVDGLARMDLLQSPMVIQSGYKGLKFYISKVKCVEETNEWGDDEIYLGGNFIDETGDASYSWFRVSKDFDTNEVVDYGFPGKELQYFNLTEAGNIFPKIYTVALTMVEEDVGNMSGWFKDLFEQVKAKLKAFLVGLGIAAGSLLGLGAVGALVGAVFGAIFDWLLGWLVGLLENNFMGTRVLQATVNSYTGNWVSGGGPIFAWSKAYKAAGGHYHVWYAWELVK
jgi:hypothetical protein